MRAHIGGGGSSSSPSSKVERIPGKRPLKSVAPKVCFGALRAFFRTDLFPAAAIIGAFREAPRRRRSTAATTITQFFSGAEISRTAYSRSRSKVFEQREKMPVAAIRRPELEQGGPAMQHASLSLSLSFD